MITALACVITLVSALCLRLLPLYLSSAGLGVDHWYWKAYREAFHREMSFPPVLPQYTLDDHQWYPPLFPLLIAHLPESLFEHYSRLVAIGVDMFRMVLVLLTAAWLSHNDPTTLVIVGLSYATSPILVSYNIQLNPRGLGALLLDGLMLVGMWAHSAPRADWVWIVGLFLATLILLTHKMTTQLMWFLLPFAAIVSSKWQFAALVPLSILAALALTRGYYWNVGRAHWDIVTFWHRNWPWLQAHPIKESPVYGNTQYETPTKFHRKGMPGVLQHIRYLGGYLPGIWVLAILMVTGVVATSDPMALYLVEWLSLILVFVIATVFVPFLKCLGSGYLYLYNAAAPAALLWGITVGNNKGPWLLWIALAVALGTSLVALQQFFGKTRRAKTDIDDLRNMADKLRAAPRGVVMCLPPQVYDLVAYMSGQPVLFGGHGYGFRRLEATFPRLLVPLEDLARRYGVRYLVTRKGYLPDSFLRELECLSTIDCGQFVIYWLADGQEAGVSLHSAGMPSSAPTI